MPSHTVTKKIYLDESRLPSTNRTSALSAQSHFLNLSYSAVTLKVHTVESHTTVPSAKGVCPNKCLADKFKSSHWRKLRNLLAVPSVQIRVPSLGTCRNIEGLSMVINFKLFCFFL
jgi:hypothetical protein